MAQVDFREIERKWQEMWEKEGIFHAEPSDKPKFFITIPYPYLNGNLHAGHTRTFTIGDAFARFMRMKGYNVLFPMGFHVTGTPIIGLAELIQKRDPKTFEVYTKFHDVPEDVLKKLDTPEKIVEYFSKEALKAMKDIGYSIDWRRVFTTTDETYQKFIEWQFYRLKELGLVVKGSHPVRYCPNDQNPVEDHDLLHGENATVVDFTVIKFRLDDGTILPCATLRPETVFGVTNIWLKPTEYVIARVDDEQWLVSEEAFEKLKYTEKKVEFVRKINAEELFGKYATNPVTKDKIPILPAEFVDTDNATGVVMSVPAHAPYDYIAIEDLKKSDLAEKYGLKDVLENIKPIVLIRIEDQEFSEGVPAEKVIRELGIKDQSDPELERATKILYKKEFHKGVLMDITGEYSGTKISQIKDRLQRDLIEKGIGDVFYEFSEKPVVCRCGTKCVVKVVKDQWFLSYSNPEWKAKVLRHLENMRIVPEYYKEEFRNKIEWLKDKACARRKGLGTRIPWDKEWLIESLSDSTIYMAYYILAKFINSGLLKAENMTKELLDYVLLGEGSLELASESSGLDKEIVEVIRRDFVYWYPVDLRSSGKDLVANHLLFFLFHHIAIFPEELWPRAIAVNGYVSLEGKKMSKSKGPLLTMKRAVADYSADVTRMYILYTSEYDSDADWRRKEVESLRSHLRRFYELVKENIKDGVESVESMLDRWLMSRFQRIVRETNLAMEALQTRRAVNSAFFEMMADVRWYLRRGGKNLSVIIDDWLKLLAPFIPHLCEELWHLRHDTFISTESYPEFDESKIDREAELSEEYIKTLINDIKEILKFVKAERVYLATADEWKYEALKVISGEKEVRSAIKKLMSDEKYRKLGKEVQNFVKNVIKEKITDFIDEEKLIKENLEFISREVGVEVEFNPEMVPESKRKSAIPMKPAIFAQ
ncbi:leucyl-tRNA synthetase [Archaeoglobus sulfaticallidus PM70-1]|uniref:Leucine--tRNA ligase n=1 Tax=Archaeoglobus sulfaticallidus PM70-1 TaxID=387631 RepID=N0BBU1_9EURY|nr:leucine--tRNA ligase [Archaeoglobus sulfaticallidus]AGK61069.1 leucyl-tRNA synthetase [Archaeoglobus sulfaticallidus PM70-1]